MDRGTGLFGATEDDFRSAQKDVARGVTAVPMRAKARITGSKLSAPGILLDVQQEGFLQITLERAADMSGQRQARERQQEEKQRQQQEKQERRQQKQHQQQQPQEQDLAVPMPAVEPTRQQPRRTCKRVVDGGLAGAQQSSVDPEQCSETQAPVEKRPRA
ncbi:hypothetical protein N2152v2_000697 [Parachlorella kessleri]